jgi:hypothetical protein
MPGVRKDDGGAREYHEIVPRLVEEREPTVGPARSWVEASSFEHRSSFFFFNLLVLLQGLGDNLECGTGTTFMYVVVTVTYCIAACLHFRRCLSTRKLS